MSTPEMLRVANCSGFLGDRLSAAREMVEGGPIDVLTGDWLAELTMLLLAQQRLKRGPGSGYARTFLTQLEQVLGTCRDRGITVVSNAGGLDPEGCAEAVLALADRLGLPVTVAHVDGDDLLPRLDELTAAGERFVNLDTGEEFAAVAQPALTANAYLGGFGIKAALDAGADVVITGRVTDAALVVGPAAHAFGWSETDLDELAGAVVAGHVIECGAQATGGNYAFFQRIPGLEHPGFPIAEVHADGSAVITKHPGTGGAVTVGTVTAQLLYELDGPAYANPDVTARFDTIDVLEVGPDRVRLSGVQGVSPPERLKVALNYLGGFTNTMTLVLTGLDVPAKAELALRSLWARTPAETYAHVDVQLIGADQVDPRSAAGAQAQLRVTVKDRDPEKVGRRFSNAFVEMALASYPGYFPTTAPHDANPYGVYWPTTVPRDTCPQRVVMHRSSPGSLGEPRPPSTTTVITQNPSLAASSRRHDEGQPVGDHEGRSDGVGEGPRVSVPLGRLVGARSGDKGGTANVGLWAPEWLGYADPAVEPDLRRRTYDWLVGWLTAARVHELLPETEGHPVRIHRLPNLFAVNVVLPGFLGRGVAANDLLDPQAKGLGERLRAIVVQVPAELVSSEAPPGGPGS